MDKLEKKLLSIETLSSECDKEFNQYENKIKKQKEEQQKEDHYLLMRDRYKQYISSFSKEYIEMSELYIGPELTRHMYQRIFHPTYLDSKEDVRELYKLFVFYLLIERIFGS
jgi:hypothetical protein